MLTAGMTNESRNGGTMPDGLAPNGQPYPERLRTRRFDVGGTYRGLAGATGLVNLRGSYSNQNHRHCFGQVMERDRHETWFGEAAYTRAVGSRTWVVGAALLGESYDGRDIEGFDYTFTTPGVFAQVTADVDANLSVTGSARVDGHSEYGTVFSPRGSVLMRLGGPWTLRASLGSGFFGPTPFTEQTEVVGLNAMRPLTGVRAERATGGSMDLGGSLGSWELNLTGFTSRIADPIVVRDAMTAVPRVEMVTMEGSLLIRGAEFLARWHAEPFRVTTTYTYVKGAERYGIWSETAWTMPLVPRHQAGVVTSYEREGVMHAGLEVYYNGSQHLENDSYRFKSKPYVSIGALAERAFGSAKLFVNAENLLDVRQTDWDPLARPFMGDGGRWTNDIWAPLDGFVMNVGLRWSFATPDE